MPYRPIQEGKHHIQYSDIPGEVLQPGGLKPGELAINSADGAVYCGGEDQSVVRLSGATSVSTAERVSTVWAKGRLLWDEDLGSLWIGTGFLGGEPAGGILEAVQAGTYASQPLDAYNQPLTGAEALGYFLNNQVPVYDGDGVKTVVDCDIGVAYAKLLPASEFGNELKIRSGNGQTIEIDWGDGTAPTTAAGNVEVTHTYSVTDKPFTLKITETTPSPIPYQTRIIMTALGGQQAGIAVATWYHCGLRSIPTGTGSYGTADPTTIAWHSMTRKGGQWNVKPDAFVAGGGAWSYLEGYILDLPAFGGIKPPADALWHFDKLHPGLNYGFVLCSMNLRDGIPDIFPDDLYGTRLGVLFRQTRMPDGVVDLRFLNNVTVGTLMDQPIISPGTTFIPPEVVRVETMGGIGGRAIDAPLNGKWNVVFQEGETNKTNTNSFDFACYEITKGYDFIPKGTLELESIDAYECGGYAIADLNTSRTFSPNVALPMKGMRAAASSWRLFSGAWARVEDKFSDADFSKATYVEIRAPKALTGYSHDLQADIEAVPCPVLMNTNSMPDCPATPVTFDYSGSTLTTIKLWDFRIDDPDMSGVEVKYILPTAQGGVNRDQNDKLYLPRPWLYDASKAPKYVFEGPANCVNFTGDIPVDAPPATAEMALNADWSIYESGVFSCDARMLINLLKAGDHNIPLDLTRLRWRENSFLNWADLLNADSSLTTEMYDKVLIWLEARFVAGDFTSSKWTFSPLAFGTSKYSSAGLVARNALIGRGISFTDGGAA